MTIGKDLKYALETWKLTENDVLPNIQHFFEFCGEDKELKTMYYYLRFLQRKLKEYKKLKYHFITFDEFLDNQYFEEKTPTEE